jgi:hypothetical protein
MFCAAFTAAATPLSRLINVVETQAEGRIHQLQGHRSLLKFIYIKFTATPECCLWMANKL